MGEGVGYSGCIVLGMTGDVDVEGGPWTFE